MVIENYLTMLKIADDIEERLTDEAVNIQKIRNLANLCHQKKLTDENYFEALNIIDELEEKYDDGYLDFNKLRESFENCLKEVKNNEWKREWKWKSF